MGYLEVYDLANAQSFRARITGAVVTFAGQVISEGAGQMTASQYGKRLQLANSVMQNPETEVRRFVWPILSNVTIASQGLASTDGDIMYQVSQIWDALSGVTLADKAV